MLERFKDLARLVVGVLLIANVTAGCGTIMHPERKGQRDGNIDAGIAVLDAIGLLFFIIPGVIAFAVDFSNGTIYLPGGRHHRTSLDLDDLRQVRFDPRRASLADIEGIIRRETGRSIDLESPEAVVSELRSIDEMLARLRRSNPQTGKKLI